MAMFQIDAEMLRALPVWFTATLLSLTVHEASHAWIGGRGGDRTAADQVTLDPTPHVAREPFGMIAVPILSFLLNGGSWMIGFASAPYDPHWAQRFRKEAALMALAGPVSNFALALLAAGVIHAGIAWGSWEPAFGGLDEVVASAGGERSALTTFVSVLFSVNILLGLFNLIPLAPLDGHAVVPLFLNEKWSRKWLRLFEDRGASFVGLAIAWVIFARLAGPVYQVSVSALYAFR